MLCLAHIFVFTAKWRVYCFIFWKSFISSFYYVLVCNFLRDSGTAESFQALPITVCKDLSWAVLALPYMWGASLYDENWSMWIFHSHFVFRMDNKHNSITALDFPIEFSHAVTWNHVHRYNLNDIKGPCTISTVPHCLDVVYHGYCWKLMLIYSSPRFLPCDSPATQC